MSVEAITWASKQTAGSPGAKLVLIALANYANDRHECWPSQNTLAQWTEQSDRTIRTHLATLESMGLISRQSREVAGCFTSDMITLHIDQRKNLPAEKSSVGKKQQIPAEKFSGKPSKEPSEKNNKARQLPGDFFPGQGHQELAAELQIDLVQEFAAFTDYHRSKGTTFKDWNAALRTWMRNARKFKSAAGNRPAGRPAKFDPVEYLRNKGNGNGTGNIIDIEAQRVA